MDKKIKILAIINPISGTGKQKNIESLLKSEIDNDKFILDIRKTEYAGHAKKISKEAIGTYQAVLAIGGDGTVNEIAQSLVYSNVCLGIIPCGSGNGLARHIGIPMCTKKAIQWLNIASERVIDSVNMNSFLYVCVAGVGFDAHISHKFAQMSSRGLISYAKACLKSFLSFDECEFSITYNNTIVKEKAMMLSFANSSQFGNNAYIAPSASLSDGMLNLVLVKKPKFYQIPLLALQMFSKGIESSSLHKQIVSDNFVIQYKGNKAHVDGEPIFIDENINVKINKSSLKVFTQSDV